MITLSSQFQRSIYSSLHIIISIDYPHLQVVWTSQGGRMLSVYVAVDVEWEYREVYSGCVMEERRVDQKTLKRSLYEVLLVLWSEPGRFNSRIGCQHAAHLLNNKRLESGGATSIFSVHWDGSRVSVVGEKGKLRLSPQQVVIGEKNNKRHYSIGFLIYNVDQLTRPMKIEIVLPTVNEEGTQGKIRCCWFS
ncbi:hypothetical protein Tco_1292528 [Tanacetum coccineum]